MASLAAFVLFALFLLALFLARGGSDDGGLLELCEFFRV